MNMNAIGIASQDAADSDIGNDKADNKLMIRCVVTSSQTHHNHNEASVIHNCIADKYLSIFD